MFGLFKKKVTEQDKRFAADLAIFAADFNPVMRNIDPENVNTMVERAYKHYLGRDADEEGQSASDFYFNALTGAVFELTDKSIIIPQDSLAIFSMVDDFLRNHPQYQNSFVLSLMNTWQNELIKIGAIRL